MLTLAEFARAHGVSYTTARKWLAQGRIEAKRVGRIYLVTSTERPPPLEPGELSAFQRRQWNYGRYKPKGADE